MRTWVNTLGPFGKAVPRAEIHVAERAAHPIAWMRLIPCGAFCVLEELWVEPAWQGAGVGSTLFWLAQRSAPDLGAQRLEWEAEPNAIGFYKRVSASAGHGACIAPVINASVVSRGAAVA